MSPRIGPWRTTVEAGPVEARDPSWTAIVHRLHIGPRREVRETGSLPAIPRLATPHAATGIASYYWQEQMTASGERFDKRQMTAAHPSLPFDTRVRVTHADTGRSVVVRINDRGPFKPGRIIDLSQAAAEQIGMTSAGLARVHLQVVQN